MDKTFKHLPLVPNDLIRINTTLPIGNCNFKLQHSIYNFSAKDITVRHRNGIVYVISPEPALEPRLSGCFVVRCSMETDRGVIKYMTHLFNDAPEVLSTAAQTLISAHREAIPSRYDQKRIANYDCVFDVSKMDREVDYYIADSDIVVTLKHHSEIGPHPFCKNADEILAARNENFEEIPMLSIIAVDNTGSRESVFMPYANKIYQIPVIEDLDLAEGIHIRHHHHYYNREGELLPSNLFIRFSEMRESVYKFFDSKVSAFEFIRTDEHFDMEITRLKRETESLKSETARQNAVTERYKSEADQYKAELAVMEAKLKRAEAEYKAVVAANTTAQLHFQERMKDLRDQQKLELEARWSFRKDVVDVFKLFSPLAMILQLLTKLKPTTGS